MKRLITLWTTAFLLAATTAIAQQPPPLTPQEQLDRARLELAYAAQEHAMCKTSLSDMWARANAMEGELRKLQDELKGLKEKPGAAAKKE
jgi:hypothetical protein